MPIETSTMAHTSSTHTDTGFSHLPMQLMRVLCPHIGPSASSPLARPSRPTRVTNSIHPFVHVSKHASSTLPAPSSRFQTPLRTHFLPFPSRCGMSCAISCSQRNTRARHATYSTASLARRFLNFRRRRWPSCTCSLWPSLPRSHLHLGFLPCRRAPWEDF
jgi:hypothetical protein